MTTSCDDLKLALIDADFLVYRVSFADPEGPNDRVCYHLTEFLQDVVYRILKCDDYKAWITGKNNFRYEVAKHVPYKDNRKNAAKPPHYDVLREHLVKLGAEVTDGDEADDAVARESVKGGCWIVHVDKDLDQLEGWHYNPVKDERYYISKFDGLKNFYKQMLTGDRTDNIEGVRGIGPVKANKLLKDCKTEQELYEVVCKVYDDNGMESSRILENANLLWLRRSETEPWCPPSCLQEPLGKSTK